MSEDKKTPQTTITKAQIEAWKKEHGKVFQYTANGKTAFFKKISMQILDAARSKSRVEQSAFKVFIAQNTFLGGDKELIETEEFLLGLFDWIDYLLVKQEGEMLEL